MSLSNKAKRRLEVALARSEEAAEVAAALDASTSGVDAILAQKGAVNGIATLDGSGKVPASQLSFDAMEYKGAWDAATNSPALANGAGNAGDFYRVSVSGTRDLGAGSKSYVVGDTVVYSGSVWDLIPSANVAQYAQTRYVDLSGNDTTGDGSFEKPFLTWEALFASITDATDVKRYLAQSIGPGDYVESVNFLPKEFISIRGVGRGLTKIRRSDNSIIPFVINYGYTSAAQGAANWSISNCTIRNLHVSRPTTGIKSTEQFFFGSYDTEFVGGFNITRSGTMTKDSDLITGLSTTADLKDGLQVSGGLPITNGTTNVTITVTGQPAGTVKMSSIYTGTTATATRTFVMPAFMYSGAGSATAFNSDKVEVIDCVSSAPAGANGGLTNVRAINSGRFLTHNFNNICLVRNDGTIPTAQATVVSATPTTVTVAPGSAFYAGDGINPQTANVFGRQVFRHASMKAGSRTAFGLVSTVGLRNGGLVTAGITGVFSAGTTYTIPPTAGGSQTVGPLIIGQQYTITTYVAGDDFTNVGGTNVTGNVFVATGTTPTTWTNASLLTFPPATPGTVFLSLPALSDQTNLFPITFSAPSPSTSSGFTYLNYDILTGIFSGVVSISGGIPTANETFTTMTQTNIRVEMSSHPKYLIQAVNAPIFHDQLLIVGLFGGSWIGGSVVLDGVSIQMAADAAGLAVNGTTIYLNGASNGININEQFRSTLERISAVPANHLHWPIPPRNAKEFIDYLGANLHGSVLIANKPIGGSIGPVSATAGTPVAGGGNVGNGTITDVLVSNITGQTEVFTVTILTVPGVNRATFSVVGSVSGALANGTLSGGGIGSPYIGTLFGGVFLISFSINDGAIDFAIGDTFTIATTAATVDLNGFALVNQTTAAQVLTLPTPTFFQVVRGFTVANVGTTPFDMYGVTIAISTAKEFMWTGSAWIPMT